MRPILTAREGLTTIVLIENGNDEAAGKEVGDAFRIPQTWYSRELLSLQTRHTRALQEGCKRRRLSSKRFSGQAFRALRPEGDFCSWGKANVQIPFDKTGWGGAS